MPEARAALLKQGLLVAAGCAFVTTLTVGALPLLRHLYASGWIAAHWYHPVFAALCILPVAVTHGAATFNGGRGASWWVAWLPGIAVYAAYPWQHAGTWRPLWIFGYAWDWGRTIFLHYDSAGPLAFNAFGTFVVMVTVAIVVGGRIWFGTVKAFGRAGSDVVTSGDAQATLPSATWANRREVVRRFSVPGGIVLGELTDPVHESPRFRPERKRSWGRQGRGQLITMSPTDGNGHVLVTSQASGYKSTGIVIPNILTYDGPLVVFDPKCELYARCRKARDAMGFKPVVIDADHGFDPARLIAALAVDHPSAYIRMAKMTIPKGHGGIENSEYFKNAAINLFAALLAYHAEVGSEAILQDIAKLLAFPPESIHREIEEELSASKLDFVKNELGALEDMDLKFWYSVKTEITNQLQFGALPDIQRYITMPADSPLPSQVIDPRCDIFLNIPQHVAEDFSAMLRLMLGSLLTAAQLIEINEAPRARRLFLIDEAAKLGNMDILENIRDRGRSLGLHLMMFYQTPGEMVKLWGQAGMTSWRDGCSATVMGPVSSRTSAQDLSAMIGTRTLRVKTESTSSSNQVMSPMAGSVSSSEQEQLRDVPLLSATAISQLPRHASVITSPGNKPMLASKAIWFTRKDMKGKVRSTDEIEGELLVTASQERLTERLAAMSRPAGERDDAGGEPRPIATNAAAMQARDMRAVTDRAEFDASVREFEDATEDAVEDGDDKAKPSLWERAMALGPRYGRPDQGPAHPRVAASLPAPVAAPAEQAEGAADGPEAGTDGASVDGSLPLPLPEEPCAEARIDGGERTEPGAEDKDGKEPRGAHPDEKGLVADPETPGNGGNGRDWSPEEGARIMSMLGSDTPPEEIAQELGRSLPEVEARIALLRGGGLAPDGVRDRSGGTGDGEPGDQA